ncbi:MAG TPA: hypothetical protein VH598_14210 [Verrucomicrobiae bacterium]|nr:hypothetical protein [Verrucomicrobiae bacterium]
MKRLLQNRTVLIEKGFVEAARLMGGQTFERRTKRANWFAD